MRRLTKRELNYTPSWALVRRHYQAAYKAVSAGRGGPGADYDSADRTGQRHAWLRKVSVEFHRRLKRAGIFVEGAA